MNHMNYVARKLEPEDAWVQGLRLRHGQSASLDMRSNLQSSAFCHVSGCRLISRVAELGRGGHYSAPQVSKGAAHCTKFCNSNSPKAWVGGFGVRGFDGCLRGFTITGNDWASVTAITPRGVALLRRLGMNPQFSESHYLIFPANCQPPRRHGRLAHLTTNNILSVEASCCRSLLLKY